jgi:hypothetical protein
MEGATSPWQKTLGQPLADDWQAVRHVVLAVLAAAFMSHLADCQ